MAENLHVKEVVVENRRYIACLNPEEAAKDKADRALIVEALEEKLRGGAKALVGNRGFRRYLHVDKDAMRIDPKKIEAEARYDGKWVLRTNTTLPAAEVARQYKQLLVVEQFFRAAKDLLETRPIFHKYTAMPWRTALRKHNCRRGVRRVVIPLHQAVLRACERYLDLDFI